MLRFGPWSALAPHPLGEAWTAASPDRLRVAVAFASEAGVRALQSLVASRPFDATPKRWLVGIENGLTQPEALACLAGLPGSEVRVPFGSEALQSPGLRAPTFFHPKLYVFDSNANVTIVSASGNLTEGGLLKNVEQFFTWTGEPSEAPACSFDDWWERLWRAADVVDPAFVAAYEAARPEIQPRVARTPPPVGPIVEAEPAPSDLKRADWMWLEAVRAPEGGSRNQLELILTGYHFFYGEDDPPRDARRRVEFVDAADRVYDNPGRIVHFNGPPITPKGNFMWRVRLPTEHEGLTGYQNGGVVLRFERTAVPDRYDLRIAPIGSREAAGWELAARKVAAIPGPPTRRMGWA